jgi:hypothetical protein
MIIPSTGNEEAGINNPQTSPYKTQDSETSQCDEWPVRPHLYSILLTPPPLELNKRRELWVANLAHPK